MIKATDKEDINNGATGFILNSPRISEVFQLSN